MPVRRYGRMLVLLVALAVSAPGPATADPVPVGQPTKVNTESGTGFHRYPRVAAAPDGRMAVAWETAAYGMSGEGPGSAQVRARVYGTDGRPVGPDFLVQGGLGTVLPPAVAMDAEGNFVVVWTTDVDLNWQGENIFLRRFDAFGDPSAPWPSLVYQGGGWQEQPAIAMAPDGRFVVAWRQDGTSVYAQRYGADGNRTGSAIPVAGPAATTIGVDVGMDAAGAFVVAWEYGRGSTFMRRFAADGQPIGAEWDPAPAEAWKASPAVAAAPGGGFMVVWEGSGDDVYPIRGRFYNANGEASGGPFPITASPDPVSSIGVAARPDGGFTVVWARTRENAGSVWVRSYLPGGQPEGRPTRVSPAGDYAWLPAVAVDGSDRAAVVWTGAIPDIWLRQVYSLDPRGDVRLTASQTRVRRGARVRLVVRMQPCGAGPDPVALFRGAKQIAKKKTIAGRATFRIRVTKTARYVAKTPVMVPHGHGGATSNGVKVRVRR